MYKVYGTTSKKMLNMLILEILEKYSDEAHKLTQQEILRLLKTIYGVEECDRRSVKANILSLIEMGIDISMEEREGYYLIQRDFEEEELRWLIDAVLFSRGLTEHQAQGLIKKLEDQGNRYFASKVSHVSAVGNMLRTDNKSVFYNVNAINDAIDRKKKIQFRYNKYGIDLKMHDKGKDYIVNPYRMVAANGRYYLIGNVDKYNNLISFRVDKISLAEILEEGAKPIKQLPGYQNGWNVPKHMAEHIYMFSGESVNVCFSTTEEMIDEVVDWFGKDITVTKPKKDSNEVLVRVTCNEKAMMYWALQYGPYVEILKPLSLREKLRDEIGKMAQKYQNAPGADIDNTKENRRKK